MIPLFALLGVVVGALINQLASDLPARRELTNPHCPYCGRDRPWWQWLALPVMLVRQDRCPHCDAPIGLRHALTELGLATLYVYLWLEIGPSINLPIYLVYSAIFALVVITDVERRLILNVVTYPAIVFGVIAAYVRPNMTLWSALLGGLIGFFAFYLMALVGHVLFGSGALGGGDVKLAAFVGLVVGFPLVIEALVLTILIGAGFSVILLILRLRSLDDYVPYGPFIVAGAMVTLLWGYPIARWFLS